LNNKTLFALPPVVVAGIVTVQFAVKVPVSLIYNFLPLAVSEPSAKLKLVFPEVSVTVVYPDEAACKICKLVLVIVPHKPDFHRLQLILMISLLSMLMP
jgi:hypothetical protein